MSKKEEKVEENKKKASTKKTATEAKTDSLDELVEDAYQSVMEESVKETKDDKKADKEEKVEAKEKKAEKPKKLTKKEQRELDEATRQAKIKALEEAALSTRSDIDVLAQDDAMEIPISDLPGVGPATTLKLKEAGLTSIRGIALSSIKELVTNADLGDKTAAKLIKLCQEQVGLTFSTADRLYTERLALDRITTGSDNLDELFGDGIETESITELFGEFRTGKTQIAHQLCVTVQLPKEKGGLGANAAYIDTEGTFRPERIVEMAERFGVDPKQALQNITVGRAYTSDHQVNLAKEIATLAR
ncbi:MAG: helix-hairpin-helix domain-containing protein, partial [Candidatus Heimdallarchaeota archaeon]